MGFFEFGSLLPHLEIFVSSHQELVPHSCLPVVSFSFAKLQLDGE